MCPKIEKLPVYKIPNYFETLAGFRNDLLSHRPGPSATEGNYFSSTFAILRICIWNLYGMFSDIVPSAVGIYLFGKTKKVNRVQNSSKTPFWFSYRDLEKHCKILAGNTGKEHDETTGGMYSPSSNISINS